MMERAFSVEEIPDPFWDLPPPVVQPQVVASDGGGGTGGTGGVVGCGDWEGGGATTDQSASEWSFERLLEEELLDGPAAPVDSSGGSTLHADPVAEVERAAAAVPVAASSPAADPVEYNAVLKRKLEEDLAAVAMWRASSAMHQERPQVSNNYIGGSESLAQNKFNGEGTINRPQIADFRVNKLAASSSSMEPSPSDEDDMDGEVEILGFTMPDQEKARKRKESNRESARRSRHRKAAHVKDLEDQVAHLRVENSALLRRLAALSQKYNDAAVDNRVLKADMETLRAKVKIAEEALGRVTGTSAPPSRLPVPTIFGGSPSGAAGSDAQVPIRGSVFGHFTAEAGASVDNRRCGPRTAPPPPSSLRAAAPGGGSGTTPATASRINRIAAASHCAAAMELLQRRVRAAPLPTTSSWSAPRGPAPPLGPNEAVDMDI